MEFKVLKLESGLVVVNFDEMKADLIAKLQGYKGYLVTNDNLALAKSDRANLNKLSKAIDDKRKEVKKEIMKIYDSVFEPQCKELVTLIKGASDEIDLQVKALEDLERTTKYELVKKVWNEFNFDLVSLDRIFKEEWLNKTTSERKVFDDMQGIINTIKGNLLVLDSTDNPSDLKAKYLNTLDLTTTMAQYQAEKEAKARLVAREQVKPVEVVKPVEIIVEEVKSVNIKVKAPLSKLKQLRTLLESNGYLFEQLSDIE